MYFLYRFHSAATKNSLGKPEEFRLNVFTPSVGAFLIKGEKFSIKTVGIRILFQIMSFGKAQIYYVENNDGELVHTSYVVPACGKFPFMGKRDIEIGPCYTYPAFRGKGIYPRVLSEICRRNQDAPAIYMIVDEANDPSIKGIEKAGFVRCGLVSKSRITKRYKKVQ